MCNTVVNNSLLLFLGFFKTDLFSELHELQSLLVVYYSIRIVSTAYTKYDSDRISFGQILYVYRTTAVLTKKHNAIFKTNSFFPSILYVLYLILG